MTNLPPTLGKNRASNYVGSDVVLKFWGKFLCRFDVVFALKTCRPEKNLLVTLNTGKKYVKVNRMSIPEGERSLNNLVKQFHPKNV